MAEHSSEVSASKLIAEAWGGLVGEGKSCHMTIGSQTSGDRKAFLDWLQDLPEVDDRGALESTSIETPQDPGTISTLAPGEGSHEGLTFDGTAQEAERLQIRPDPSRSEFTIERKVASGGMGEVFLARQTGLDRVVAVKRPNARALASAEKLADFIREGEVTGSLEHPNIVPIYLSGVDVEGRPYYAMKLVKGVEWRRLLHPPEGDHGLAEKAGLMTLDDHLDILLRLADAVAFAHSRGIIHRDLKPENVMVGDFGEVQLMDWGIALRIGKGAVSSAAGTPAYMAPEMALVQSERIGYATDVYLLGAILYEILTDAPPHVGADAMNSILMAAMNRFTPVLERNPDAPKGLAEIAAKALAADPDDRYPSVAAFQAAIRESRRHAQSQRLAEAAEAGLHELSGRQSTAKMDGADYARYAEIAGAFRQALELWAGNVQAREGLARTLAHFVRSAISGGDIGLARSQLVQYEAAVEEYDPAVLELRGELERADVRAKRRKRYFGALAALVALLCATLVGGAAYSYRSILAERDEAERQRGLAEDSLTLAENRRGEAEEERAWAELQRRLAEEGFALADRERRQAELERERAERNYELAEARRLESEARRIEALRNLAEIDVERALGRIESERDYPDAARYLLRAIRTMGDADTTDLRRRLARLVMVSPRIERVFDLPAPARVVRFDGNGRLAALLSDGSTFAPDGGEAPAAIEVSRPELADAVCVAKGADGRIAFGTRDGMAFVFDSRDSETPSLAVHAHGGGTLAAAFLPGGDLVTAGADGRAVRWDTEGGLPRAAVRAHASYVGALAVRGDGEMIATAGGDGLVRVWAARDFSERASLEGHAREAGAVAFRPGTTQVASQAWDGTVRIWDYSPARNARVAALHFRADGDALSLAFSPDGGKLACISGARSVTIWDVSERCDITPPEWRSIRIRGGRFARTAEGRLIAGVHGGEAHDLAGLPPDATVAAGQAVFKNGAITIRGSGGVRRLEPEVEDVRQVALAPDGRFVVVRVGGPELVVLDARTGRVEKRLAAHSSIVGSMAVDETGRWMVTGGAGGTVYLWDLADMTPTALANVGGWVEDIFITTSGGWIACLRDDGSLRKLALPEADVESHLDELARGTRLMLGIGGEEGR